MGIDVEYKNLEQALSEANKRLQEQAGEIAALNDELRVETEQRVKAEEALRRAHDVLEIRVQDRMKDLEEVSKSAEAERQRFYDVLEMLPSYLILLSPDYHIPFANRFFRERFGESRGRRCYEYLFDRNEPCEICDTYKTLKENAPQRWEWTGPDGRIYDIYDFPFTDADGSPLIMEMGIDITEQRQAEQALREINESLEQRVAERTALLAASEAQFHLAVDNMPDVLALYDAERRYKYVNAAGVELSGLPMEAYLGKRDEDMYGPNIDNRLLPALQRTYETATPQTIETILNLPTSCYYFIVKYVPMLKDGRVEQVMQFAFDITERKKIENALTEARDLLQHHVNLLQQALIPAKPQIIEGYSVASAYIPAYEGTEIGGDFIDVFQTEDGKVGILIGDVSGKGIESAALAATTRSTIRAFAYDLSSPGEALSHANSLLTAQQTDNMQFVTAYLIILDPATGDINYSSAGHPPAIISREDGDTLLLCAYNMPLGIQGNITYEECRYNIMPGEKLVLYTDGITEARHDHDFFGTEGIENVLSIYGRTNPVELVEAILYSVRDWAHGKLRDDTAVLIIGRDC
ncbi:MAG: PP2C family protein-serine/threonine phosphatase [Armatimonadota bacterium]